MTTQSKRLFQALIMLGALLHPHFRLTAQSSGPAWQPRMQRMLQEFLACKAPIDDKSPCNVFLGRALKLVYNIADFDLPGQPDTFLSANEIANKVASANSNWTLLGTAD